MKRDGSAAGGDVLGLVLIRLGRRDRLAGGVDSGGVLGGEAPGVEGAGADVGGEGAVVLVAAGFEGEVDKAGALILGVRGAGDDLELVDGFDGEGVGDDAVIAILVDGGDGDTVDVDGSEVVAGSADDGGAGSGDDAGDKDGEGGGVTLLAALLEGKVGVGLVLHHRAEGGVGGLQRGRCGGDGDLLVLVADLEGDVEAGELEGVYGEILLLDGLEALGGDRDGVDAGDDGRDGVEAVAGGGAGGGHAGGDIGRGDGGSGDHCAGLVDDGALDAGFTAGLRKQGMGGGEETDEGER